MQFDLINQKKKDKKGYQNSGQIVVKSVKIVQDSTFLDYVRGGLRINLCVAVDMTGGDHPGLVLYFNISLNLLYIRASHFSI